ncbi:MAG: hypothetical protein Q9166_006532 [cf. Caloplaca sp. 2 TL-2023]
MATNFHRICRVALAPFFSTQSVQRLEPAVQSMVDKFTTRLRGLQGTGKVVSVVYMYCALMMGIISEYRLRKRMERWKGRIAGANWFDLVVSASEMGRMNKQFGWLGPTLRALPVSLVEKTGS